MSYEHFSILMCIKCIIEHKSINSAEECLDTKFDILLWKLWLLSLNLKSVIVWNDELNKNTFEELSECVESSKATLLLMILKFKDTIQL